jgi:hypothetical protein
MARLSKSLSQPKRVVDVFGALFGRAIGQDDTGLLSLATGESLACLNHLVHRGELQFTIDAAGVAWYST